MSSRQNPEVTLLEQPILPTLTRLALPIFVGMTLMASVGLVDAYFISGVGTEALAGFGFAFPVVMLLRAGLFGFGAGITSTVSRAAGENDMPRVVSLIRIGMVALLALAFCLTALVFVLRHTLVQALGAEPAAANQALAYLVPFLLSTLLSALSISGTAALRGLGDAASSAAAMSIAAVANAVLDPLLIHGVGPIPAMGIAGAAMATVLGAAAAAAFTVRRVTRRLASLGRPQGGKVSGFLKDIVAVGGPATVGQLIGPLCTAGITFLIASYGSIAMAGYAIVGRLEFQITMLPLSLAIGLEPLVGQSWGSGNRSRASEAWNWALRGAATWGLVVWVLMLVAGRSIASFFTNQAEVVDATQQILMVVPAGYASAGMCMATTSALGALGHAGRALRVAVVYAFCILPLCVLAGSRFYGLQGVFWGFAVAVTIEFLLFAYVMRRSLLLASDGIVAAAAPVVSDAQ